MIIASLASSFRRSTFTGSTLLNSYMEKTPREFIQIQNLTIVFGMNGLILVPTSQHKQT
jgi:hypothetical protein